MPLPWDYYRQQVMNFEGNPNSPAFFRSQWDVNAPRIGYGTHYRQGQDTSLAGLTADFDREFGDATARVDKFAPNLPIGKRAALSSLTYNAGPGWMNQGLGRAVQAGDWEDARNRFLQYTSRDPRYQKGLLNRRTKETGWFGDNGPAAPLGVPRSGNITDLNDPKYQEPLTPAEIMGMAKAQIPGASFAGASFEDRRRAAIESIRRRNAKYDPAEGGVSPQEYFTPGEYPEAGGLDLSTLSRRSIPRVNPVIPTAPPAELQASEGADVAPPVFNPGDVGGSLEETPQELSRPTLPPDPFFIGEEPPQAIPEVDPRFPPMGSRDFMDPRLGPTGGGFAPPVPGIDLPNFGGLQGTGILPGVTDFNMAEQPVPPIEGVSGADALKEMNKPVEKGDQNVQVPPSLEDRSFAAAILGPEWAGRLRGIINNEAVRSGLGILTNHPELANNLRNIYAGNEEARKAELHARGQYDYAQQFAAYRDAFPNGPGGAPNMNSKLLAGLTPQAAQVVASAGVTEGIGWLQKYQLKDAEGRAEMLRKLELMNTIAGGETPGGAGGGVTTTAMPQPTGPQVPPDVGGLGQPSIVSGRSPESGVALSRFMGGGGAAAAPARPAIVGGGGGGGAPAPAPSLPQIAGAMPQLPPMGGAGRGGGYGGPQGGPGGLPYDPIVPAFGRYMPLSEAQRRAQLAEMVGIKSGLTEKAIEQALVPGQEYAKGLATKQAEQVSGMPEARVVMSGVLDGLNRMEDLSEKLRNDKNLARVVGENVDPIDDPNAPKYPGTNIPLASWQRRSKAIGDPAWDTRSNLMTLASQLGLSTLNALRQGQKTGATGLGSTSETEIQMLKAAISGIQDLRISYPQMLQNLQIIIDTTKNVRERLLGGWQENYGQPYHHPGGNEPTRYPTDRGFPLDLTKKQQENMEKTINKGNTPSAIPGALGNIVGEYVAKQINARTPRDQANDKMRNGGWSAVEIQ